MSDPFASFFATKGTVETKKEFAQKAIYHDEQTDTMYVCTEEKIIRDKNSTINRPVFVIQESSLITFKINDGISIDIGHDGETLVTTIKNASKRCDLDELRIGILHIGKVTCQEYEDKQDE